MELSEITSLLYVGTTPGRKDYVTLRSLGIELVINMRIERPPAPDLHLPPMTTLWLPVFDSPFIPIPVHMLQRGVEAALQVMAQEKKVYAHCAAGAHRSVALAACILISLGQSAEQAMSLIKSRRKAADPGIWYIRRQILRFAEKHR
jgi:protein-tyrosine phosphatase